MGAVPSSAEELHDIGDCLSHIRIQCRNKKLTVFLNVGHVTIPFP